MTLAGAGKLRKPGRPRPARLLAWYESNRRDLPWRAPPGGAADPYRVWLSEIMLQQTTVNAVKPYYVRFLDRWPAIEALAMAPRAEVLAAWAGLGYYARACNLHACARAVVARHGGRFPADEAALRELPGIGDYTAAAIAAIAFARRASPVDGNIERVIARLFAVEESLPAAKPLIRRLARDLTPARRAGDFAQALMDLGATLCTPRQPDCGRCPWRDACRARARGDAATFPRKARKRAGRLRRGAAFVVLRADGHVLLRTRPARGLFGGMTEVPSSAWAADVDVESALAAAPRLVAARPRFARLEGVVRHVFTHFALEIVVYRARVARGKRARKPARFVAAHRLDVEALPTLMRKILAHAGVAVLPGARRGENTKPEE
ncbi:MAG: A/G-specific adenine glycosylase [Proteobacteria bacterium]|nr:A/G-specific adenine glycosylase [Pseudomonadota bacterium]